MAGIQNFNAFTYKTVDGETITATKNNGVVTLNGDKNGVRQMPLDAFWKQFLATAPKLERTPAKDSVNFKGATTPEKSEVSNTEIAKKEASTGKKWGVGIASAFIPGLGQAINGDWGKAAGFLAGGIAASLLVGPWLGLAIGIGSIIDAVQSAKA